MTEILFRGKRADNGEWVEGSLVSIYDGGKFILPSESKVYIPQNKNMISSCEFYEVVPETVCQYTGLTDKNRRKIFEGDILNVTYSDRQGECHHAENYVLNDLKNTSVVGWLDYAYEIEVAGNVFDNADLMGG